MNDKRTCGICGLMHEPHHDTGRNICVETALTELAFLRASVADRDAAIARMHKALIDVIEHQAELNTSYGRPISHSKTIALAISGLDEDEAAAIRARNETKE